MAVKLLRSIWSAVRKFKKHTIYFSSVIISPREAHRTVPIETKQPLRKGLPKQLSSLNSPKYQNSYLSLFSTTRSSRSIILRVSSTGIASNIANVRRSGCRLVKFDILSLLLHSDFHCFKNCFIQKKTRFELRIKKINIEIASLSGISRSSKILVFWAKLLRHQSVHD